MDKETLSNYGWIVIAVLVLSVMIALSTPFGTFVSEAVQDTAQGLFDVNRTALNSTGLMYVKDQGFDGRYDHGVPELHPNNNKTPVDGEKYLHGDYIYTYSAAECGWVVSINTDVTDKNQTSYGAILESINGKPIVSLYYTFSYCTSLITAPVIPSGVKDLHCTFEGCESLKTYVGSTNPDGDFNGYIIPDTVTSMHCTFWGCKSITVAPDLSRAINLHNMASAFSGCSSLIVAPTIPNNVENMAYTFNGCAKLKIAPTIPNSVTNMQYAFLYCISLTTFDTVPSNVTDITRTFDGCISLTGNIIINATSLYSLDGCFENTTKPISLNGNCPQLEAITQTCNNNNVTIQE